MIGGAIQVSGNAPPVTIDEWRYVFTIDDSSGG